MFTIKPPFRILGIASYCLPSSLQNVDFIHKGYLGNYVQLYHSVKVSPHHRAPSPTPTARRLALSSSPSPKLLSLPPSHSASRHCHALVTARPVPPAAYSLPRPSHHPWCPADEKPFAMATSRTALRGKKTNRPHPHPLIHPSSFNCLHVASALNTSFMVALDAIVHQW